MSKPRRTWLQRGVITLNLVMIMVALGSAWLIKQSYGKVSEINRVQLEGALSPIPEPSNPGQRVVNVLLVGSDSSEGLDPDDPIQVDRIGERNGDVIIIAHLNEADGTAALLSVPRDLWVPIAGRDREARINSAYAVGGAATLIETIEENFDIPINHYVNIDFAGFQGLVEALGEVEVFFPAPARDWNATYNRTQTGFRMDTPGCHALDPETALAYVRSRHYQTQAADGTWINDTQGDLGRIRRQQDFLRRLGQTAVDDGARNPFVLNRLIDAMVSNVTLDQELTPQFLVDIAQEFRDFEPGELQTYSYPADLGWAGTNSVLFGRPEEAAPLVALFNGASPDDPETIHVSVLHVADTQAQAETYAARLRDVGFEIDDPAPVPLGPGMSVRHGPDGMEAAKVVLRALGQDLPTQEVAGIAGREVLVVLGGPSPSDLGPDGESSPTTAAPPASTNTTEQDPETPANQPNEDVKTATTRPSDSSTDFDSEPTIVTGLAKTADEDNDQVEAVSCG